MDLIMINQIFVLSLQMLFYKRIHVKLKNQKQNTSFEVKFYNAIECLKEQKCKIKICGSIRLEKPLFSKIDVRKILYGKKLYELSELETIVNKSSICEHFEIHIEE